MYYLILNKFYIYTFAGYNICVPKSEMHNLYRISLVKPELITTKLLYVEFKFYLLVIWSQYDTILILLLL